MQASSNQLSLALESSRESFPSLCSPSGSTGVAPVVVTPAASLPGDCIPASMSGDEWEFAALHVIAKRAAPAPCFFPQPLYRRAAVLALSNGGAQGLQLRDDFYDAPWLSSPIDATEWLPSGSHDSMSFFNEVQEFSVVRRGGYVY